VSAPQWTTARSGPRRDSRGCSARILAVADEVDEAFYGDRLTRIRPDVVIGCGDLPFDYLEYLVSRLDVPLLYVPGNHDPSLKPPDTTWTPLRFTGAPAPGPLGCIDIDGRVSEVHGFRIAGLGGSLRYREGPNQYTQGQMSRRALRLEVALRLKLARRGRKLDVLVTHAPPFGAAEAQDAAHVGFVAFHRLIRTFRPALALHGHVHPYGHAVTERQIGPTRVVNVIASRLVEI
jgi:hypothetical protein